jgi:hypothetical protein
VAMTIGRRPRDRDMPMKVNRLAARLAGDPLGGSSTNRWADRTVSRVPSSLLLSERSPPHRFLHAIRTRLFCRIVGQSKRSRGEHEVSNG